MNVTPISIEEAADAIDQMQGRQTTDCGVFSIHVGTIQGQKAAIVTAANDKHVRLTA